MSDLTFRLAVSTNVGNVRTNNEDNFIVCPNLDGNDWLIPKNTNSQINLSQNGCLLVVADGMGGMNAGEVASEIAVESIKEIFSSARLEKIKKKNRTIDSFLEKAVTTADKNIKKRVETDPQTSGMGTTIVIAWIVDGYAHIAWCGDSRAYCYNDNRGLRRLTRDHSYVQQLVDAGKLDPELAFDHPNSNIITRSLGDCSTKAKPDIISYKLSAGDLLILCSDGLCGLCRDEEISSVVDICNYDDIEDIKSSLISAALDAGGYDNVTVALFQCVSAAEEILSSTVANFVRVPQEKENEEDMSAAEPKAEIDDAASQCVETHSAEDSCNEDENENKKRENGEEKSKPVQMDSTIFQPRKPRRRHRGLVPFLLVIILIAAYAAYYYYFQIK